VGSRPRREHLTARTTRVRSALDELTQQLRNGGRWADLDTAAGDVQRYGDGTMVDLFDLMQRMAGASQKAVVRRRAAAVAAATRHIISISRRIHSGTS
jgi:hypothetical protein